MKQNWIYKMVFTVVVFVAMEQTAVAQRAYYDTRTHIIICVCGNNVFKIDGRLLNPCKEQGCTYTDYVACDKCKRKWRCHRKNVGNYEYKYNLTLISGSNRNARVGHLPHAAKEDSCYTVVKEVDKLRGRETVTVESYLCNDDIWCTVEGQATVYRVSPGYPQTIVRKLGTSEKRISVSHKKPKAGTPVK